MSVLFAADDSIQVWNINLCLGMPHISLKSDSAIVLILNGMLLQRSDCDVFKQFRTACLQRVMNGNSPFYVWRVCVCTGKFGFFLIDTELFFSECY